MKTNRSKKLDDEIRIWIKHYLQSGDKSYLGNIYEKYKQMLFLHCLRLIQDQEEAKDLTSDAFIRAFGSLQKFDAKKPFYPWLAQIATNLCIDFLRRQKFFQYNKLENGKDLKTPDSAADAIEQKEAAEAIKQALKKLKRRQKRCFCLFYIQHKSYKEIAQITGYSLAEIRSHIQNGRRNFKLAIEKKGMVIFSLVL